VSASAFAGELRRLLRLAGPIIISQLGQIGMNTADTIMVGPLGATPLAAAGVGSALHSFGVILCTGVIFGMAPLVSQAFGAGDGRGCRRVLVQGLWLATLVSAPVAWFSWIGHTVTLATGQDAEVAALAGAYLRALAPGVLPLFLFTAFRQYLDAMNRPTPTMVITFLGLAINIAANRAFIYGIEGWIPALGVEGTGWATTLVRWSMLAAMLGYVLAHREIRPFAGVRLAVDRPLLARIGRIGAPIGGQFGLEVGLFSFAAVMMGWLGPLELAAHQVTINIAATTFMVALGTSMAGSIRVGQHIGAGRHDAMQRAIFATYAMVIIFMAACALLFVAAPRGLIRLYTPDEPIIALGARLLLVAALFQVFDGAQVAGMSVLRGAADTRVPMIVAGIGYWLVGLPIALWLAFRAGLGALGVWIGLSAGLAAVALILLVRVRAVLFRASPVARVVTGSGT
jgi:multidrug resistance protein, MATE family